MVILHLHSAVPGPAPCYDVVVSAPGFACSVPVEPERDSTTGRLSVMSSGG